MRWYRKCLSQQLVGAAPLDPSSVAQHWVESYFAALRGRFVLGYNILPKHILPLRGRCARALAPLHPRVHPTIAAAAAVHFARVRWSRVERSLVAHAASRVAADRSHAIDACVGGH